jgi:hypothetical protein
VFVAYYVPIALVSKNRRRSKPLKAPSAVVVATTSTKWLAN